MTRAALPIPGARPRGDFPPHGAGREGGPLHGRPLSGFARLAVQRRRRERRPGKWMADITQWLQQARRGDTDRLGDVFAELYPELRRLARSRLGAGEATLTPTVLVHEAFLRLTGGSAAPGDRRHFFASAARAMRSIVVDAARRRQAGKRGGGEADLTLTERMLPGTGHDVELLSLDQVLDAMRAQRPRQVEVVELHYFAGCGFGEIAGLFGCSERTVKRDWERARAYLHARLAPED